MSESEQQRHKTETTRGVEIKASVNHVCLVQMSFSLARQTTNTILCSYSTTTTWETSRGLLSPLVHTQFQSTTYIFPGFPLLQNLNACQLRDNLALIFETLWSLWLQQRKPQTIVLSAGLDQQVSYFVFALTSIFGFRGPSRSLGWFTRTTQV